ncbi:RrF2 family transcriptional regulator [Pseudorhodoferax soli]|uniref:RrF2 family transcriptional regulator n=1 Tax=Pseudorhodoferax soli TaxID=545864 RepID=UPI000DF2FFA1|nr:Rrf2 family transcriptional regulator [Pseudorhodoferax soli]
MRLNTKSRLALGAMIDVALREHFGPVALTALAGHHRTSLSQLELLFGHLRRAGLVHGTRGTNGGYILARATSLITVADVVMAVDKRSAQDARDACVTPMPAVIGPGESLALKLWSDWSLHTLESFQGITLKQLVEAAQVDSPPTRPSIMRSIVPDRPRPWPLIERGPNSVSSLRSRFDVTASGPRKTKIPE